MSRLSLILWFQEKAHRRESTIGSIKEFNASVSMNDKDRAFGLSYYLFRG
jgi:hypothetical protein